MPRKTIKQRKERDLAKQNTDSFGFQEEVEIEENPTSRVDELKKLVEEENTTDPEEIMLLIMQVFTIEALYPEPGNYYTFIYNPKTSDITYDQHPLIACVGLFRWGFRGLNFHWQKYRNYTWEEVAGKLHVVENQELDELLALQYGKFLLNN